VDDIFTVRPVNGNASSPRHKADDLIARDWAAAAGETDGKIVRPLDDDAA
jgi:hypothetical protein